ncbi:MAG: hypothetical protein WAZ30_11475 [Syntrophorhabdus sp.]
MISKDFKDKIDKISDNREELIAVLNKLDDEKRRLVSYTDCISFVLMRSSKIDRAFTFDKHFEIAGFLII